MSNWLRKDTLFKRGMWKRTFKKRDKKTFHRYRLIGRELLQGRTIDENHDE